MSEAKRKAGVVASFNYVEETKQGWKKYDIALEGGDAFRALFPKDCDYELTSGDHLEFQEGKFGGFIIDQHKLPGRENGASTSNKSSSGGGSNKQGYWESKETYEREVRDPKIEFQTYFREVMGMYGEAIGHLEKAPVDTDELDQYIDSAFDKAKELFERVQKKD